jgi:dihydrofolate reductase
MKRKIILYIATSIDSMIADKDGDINWLSEFSDSDYGYSEFFLSIDTILMGNKTYQQVLGFAPEFIYKNTECFVFTKNKELENDGNVEFIHSDFEQFINKLKNERSRKDIWLVGGGEINAIFLENNWIDEFRIFIMPLVLGNGVPLFSKMDKQIGLSLKETKKYKSGAIELKYIKK